MGITSFVIALVSLLSLLLLGIVVVAAASTWDAEPAEQSPINYVIGGWVFGTGVLSLTGIVFAIGGLLQARRRRGLALVGLLANIGLPIAVMGVLVLALTFRPPSHSVSYPPLHWDPANWNSPFSRAMRWLTLGMTLLVVWRLVGLRRRRAMALAIGAVAACAGCGKPLPPNARFCRRCGKCLDLH
jgi:hypothetical protein